MKLLVAAFDAQSGVVAEGSGIWGNLQWHAGLVPIYRGGRLFIQ